MINIKNNSVILFDGICNLCNNAIQFIIKRDKKEHFLYASLQSDAAEQILLQYNLKNSNFDSIILVEDGIVYQKSTAILKIYKKLGGIWYLLYGFIIVPKTIRDAVYSFIANRRYRWFGKRETCMVPTEALKNKFLD